MRDSGEMIGGGCDHLIEGGMAKFVKSRINGPALGEFSEPIAKFGLTSFDVIRNITFTGVGGFGELPLPSLPRR